MTDENEYVTISEIAKELRVSKMTIYRLIHTMELPALQVGRNFRVKRSALAAYIQRNETM